MCLYDIRTGKAERRIVMAVSLAHLTLNPHFGRLTASTLVIGLDALQRPLMVPDVTHGHATRIRGSQLVHI